MPMCFVYYVLIAETMIRLKGQQKLNLCFCILAQKYLVYQHKGIIDLIQNL